MLLSATLCLPTPSFPGHLLCRPRRASPPQPSLDPGDAPSLHKPEPHSQHHVPAFFGYALDQQTVNYIPPKRYIMHTRSSPVSVSTDNIHYETHIKNTEIKQEEVKKKSSYKFLPPPWQTVSGEVLWRLWVPSISRRLQVLGPRGRGPRLLSQQRQQLDPRTAIILLPTQPEHLSQRTPGLGQAQGLRTQEPPGCRQEVKDWDPPPTQRRRQLLPQQQTLQPIHGDFCVLTQRQ